MKSSAKPSFNLRAFTALTAATAGLGMPLTGYANHLYQMSPMTVTRHAWMSAHTILGIVFSVVTIWHIVLNRHVLFNYAKDKALRTSHISREAILAVGVVGFFLFIALGHALH
ncbi:MAG: DUF4405 domain-containing protein [Pseudomonadota bacterium]